MSRPDDFSDTDLSAWLDGELDAGRRDQVEAWLREHPEAAARTRLWAADRDALRARLDPVLGEPVPSALQHRVWQHPSPPRWAFAAAAAGLLVAGGLIGAASIWQWQVQRATSALAAGTPAGWVQRAALAHSVYVPEPLHAVEVKAAEEHLARWLTRRINIEVKLYDLRDEGFELVGGRLLPDAGGKSAQLMYENPQTRQRVTVYLRKPDADAPTAFRYLQQGELGMFYWVEAGAGCALVGALPKERLLALAQAIYKQLPSEQAGHTPPR
jgi:anti-sigma factor RsiW